MHSPDSFELKALIHTNYLFTPDEHAKLLKHGALAALLDRGGALPSTDRQLEFVKVCRGETTPKSDFEFLWLRYKESIQTDQRISALTEDVTRYQHDANTLRKTLFAEIEKAKTHTEELDNLIKKLQAKLSTYERKLGINQPEPRNPTNKYAGGVDEWREQP